MEGQSDWRQIPQSKARKPKQRAVHYISAAREYICTSLDNTLKCRKNTPFSVQKDMCLIHKYIRGARKYIIQQSAQHHSALSKLAPLSGI